MARLKHAVSGVVVSVADEKVDRLGSEWVRLDEQTSDEEAETTEDEGAGEVAPPAEPEQAPEPEHEQAPPAKRSRYRK